MKLKTDVKRVACRLSRPSSRFAFGERNAPNGGCGGLARLRAGGGAGARPRAAETAEVGPQGKRCTLLRRDVSSQARWHETTSPSGYTV